MRLYVLFRLGVLVKSSASFIKLLISFIVVGLSFLFIETKELCEARAKLEMSSNLADEPSLAVLLPPHLKLLDEKVTATRFHTVNENPFETVNL